MVEKEGIEEHVEIEGCQPNGVAKGVKHEMVCDVNDGDRDQAEDFHQDKPEMGTHHARIPFPLLVLRLAQFKVRLVGLRIIRIKPKAKKAFRLIFTNNIT